MKPGRGDAESCEFVPRVVIGYEDFDSGVRAMDLYRRALAPAIGKGEVKIWKFEPLGIPELLAEAINDVAEADVLIISIAGNRPLPLEAVKLVERCAESANSPGAILFLPDPAKEMQPAAALASAYLEEVARKREAQYFAPAACAPGRAVHFSNHLVENAVLHADRHDRWGLNE